MSVNLSDSITPEKNNSPDSTGHAPVPWSAKHVGDSSVVGAIFEILDRNGRKVAEYVLERDAIRILRALNSHDDLLRAAKRALAVLKSQGESVGPANALGALDAAIAKAEARQS